MNAENINTLRAMGHYQLADAYAALRACVEALEAANHDIQQTHTGEGYSKAYIAERLLFISCNIDVALAHAREVMGEK